MKLKRLLNIFLSVLSGVLVLSCEDKNASRTDQVSEFRVAKSLYKIDANGGEVTVKYSSSGNAAGKIAEVSTDAEWIEVKSANSNKIILGVEENVSSQDRTATLLLTADGVESVTLHLLQSKVSDSTPAYSNFTITTSNITSSSVDVEVEPLNPSAYYYTDLFAASQYDAYGETYIVNSVLNYVANLISYSGVEDPHQLLYQGYYNSAYDENVSLDLRDDTDYYVVAVDVDFDASLNMITSGKGVFHKFHTAQAKQVEMDFTFRINGTLVEVTPSADYTYVCGIVSKSQWDAYADKKDAARDYVAVAKQYDMLDTIVLSGKNTVDFTYLLESAGEYVVYAAGYRNTSADKGISSEVSYQTFTFKK